MYPAQSEHGEQKVDPEIEPWRSALLNWDQAFPEPRLRLSRVVIIEREKAFFSLAELFFHGVEEGDGGMVGHGF